MRRRNFLTMGAAQPGWSLCRVFATSCRTTTRAARPAVGSRDMGPGSLRELAAQIGLRIGTAVIPFDLDTPRTRPSSRAVLGRHSGQRDEVGGGRTGAGSVRLVGR